MSDFYGKILYGSIFILLFPLLMIYWSFMTSAIVITPVPYHSIISWLLISVGGLFILLGMLNLKIYGKGLPMNAYPPSYYVRKGVYTIHKHPIYLGTIMLSFGLSMCFQSSSGFWLVSPTLCVMIIVYVLGFENEIIEENFGSQNHRTLFSLPQSSITKSILQQKIGFILFVFMLLTLSEFLIQKLEVTCQYDSVIDLFSKEKTLGLLQSFSVILILIFPFIFIYEKDLRDFRLNILILVIGISFYYIFIQSLLFSKGIKYLWQVDLNLVSTDFRYSAFLFGFLMLYAFKLVEKIISSSWIVSNLIVFILFLIFTTFYKSYLLELWVAYLFILSIRSKMSIWNLLRKFSEYIGNSWNEKRIGNIRIINHGYYGGMASFFGMIIIGYFMPTNTLFFLPILTVFTIVGAALWAQLLEGSPRLLRPYGYYGSVLGAILASVCLYLFTGVHPFEIMAAVAMSAPWVQIIGRFRCLVQGCCHGKKTNQYLGIRFFHVKSRVNKISSLKGEFLHPTQIYSMATNLITGLIMFKLAYHQVPCTFIVGIYLVMNGLGRFIEEYYRGEAQTPYWKGMRIYQWIAIINILIGVFFTSIDSIAISNNGLNNELILISMATGLFALFAYGIDFPNSNRRFARLTSD